AFSPVHTLGVVAGRRRTQLGVRDRNLFVGASGRRLQTEDPQSYTGRHPGARQTGLDQVFPFPKRTEHAMVRLGSGRQSRESKSILSHVGPPWGVGWQKSRRGVLEVGRRGGVIQVAPPYSPGR